MLTHDEDWSIILSSLDLEDESSTSSREIEREQRPELDFKPPEIHLELPPVNTSDAIDESTNLDETISIDHPSPTEVRGSFGSGSGSETDTIVSHIIEPDSPISGTTSTARPLDSKILFYENLSSINESIKQRSSDFYSSFARTKLDKLNDYISPQKETCGYPEFFVSSEDLEEPSTPEFVGCPGAVTSPGKGFLGIVPDKEQRYKNKVSRTIAKIQEVLDAHSGYLYYYCTGIVLSILMGPYFYSYVSNIFLQSAKPDPVLNTSLLSEPVKFARGGWDFIMKELDKYIYEEESVRYFLFSKKKRTNRIISLTTRIATSSVSGGRALFATYVTAPSVAVHAHYNKYAPVVLRWLSDHGSKELNLLQNRCLSAFQSSNQYLLFWLNRSQNFSVFAYSRAQEITDLSLHLAYKSAVNGWNSLSHYSRSGWQNYTTFRDHFVEVVSTAEETREAATAFKRAGSEASKTALYHIQIGSVQIHNAWKRFLATWK